MQALTAAAFLLLPFVCGDITIDWSGTSSPAAYSVTKVDSVTFTWTGTHDVYRVADQANYASCTQAGGGPVAGVSNGGSYTLSVGNFPAGTYYFLSLIHI